MIITQFLDFFEIFSFKPVYIYDERFHIFVLLKADFKISLALL